MLIYNTLSGQKEDLENILNGSKIIRLFVCGPTVYDYAHIGNARTYVFFDLFVRYLRSKKYKVSYLQNITDIDDKIIKRAAEEKISWKKVAKKYGKAYHEDEKSLGIDSVSKYAPATKYIKQIIGQIKKLLEKGNAYIVNNDGIYFDITTFPEYGKLSRRTAAQAEDSISRIDESVNKKNKGDFALWKFAKSGEPSWKAPFGEGRPGWHIEDTAITEYHFGSQYEIHGGAIDLKFPHHEAEIAQQESISGKSPLAKLWMHPGFLLVNGEKMSKSLGNFVTIRDFLKKYSPSTFRLIVAQHHYRSPMDYSEKLAENAVKTLDSVSQLLGKIKKLKTRGGSNFSIEEAEADFQKALEDDFNAPQAIAAVFQAIGKINENFWTLSNETSKKAAQWIQNKFELFGIEIELPKIPLKIRLLAKKRELFRSNKQFMQSDDLRKEIEALGYTIEDTPTGPFVWPKL